MAPCAYAVLVLGSAGRGESLLALDQDNAIIFAEGAPGGAEDRYFARLGARLADMLDAVGIPYCRGGVMAREDAWRGSLDTWRERVADWLTRSSPEDLLSVDIFFDARAVHGDMRLADALMSEAHGKASQAPQFIKLLAAASPEPPASIGLFGRLKSDNGRLDLKRAALLPIVSAARLLAMRYGVDRRSTPARLSGVLEIGARRRGRPRRHHRRPRGRAGRHPAPADPRHSRRDQPEQSRRGGATQGAGAGGREGRAAGGAGTERAGAGYAVLRNLACGRRGWARIRADGEGGASEMKLHRVEAR